MQEAAAGLTAALDPMMQACGGTWVAGGAGDADRENVDENDRTQVPPEEPKYTLKRVWMSKSEVDKFYFGFSNQTLWPLCHDVFEKPKFDTSFWDGYKHSNELYANAVLEEIAEVDKALIWFQDYHLALTPRMTREGVKSGQEVKTAHFWHIPWPHWQTYDRCPWSEELLDGLLANELIGFHLHSHCVNFLACAEELLGAKVDYGELTVTHDGHTTVVRPIPISIDFEKRSESAREEGVKEEIERVRSHTYIPYQYIGLGVDRIDYTKGIPERFKAIDRFLEKYPEYQNNFVFVELGAPSRTRVPEYRDLNEKLDKMVEEINWKYKRGYWEPINFIRKKVEMNRLLALQRTADVCIVSSLHDGMNLVAKEYVAANVDKSGTLVLSKFAGAADELEDGAVLTNPYDVEKFADDIKKALDLSEDEKRRRMENMRNTVREGNAYNWLNTFLNEMSKLA